MLKTSEELLVNLFFEYALQYYVAGRSAYFGQSLPVAGNLFHSAVEMFLKSFLMEHGYSAKTLKVDFYHDVKKLWKEYKNLTKNSALKAFDQVIKDINVVEKLRYPNKSYTFATEHQKGPKSKVTGPMTKGFVQCHLNLEEVDELISALLKDNNVTPEWLRSKLSRGDAGAQYKRENRHSFI